MPLALLERCVQARPTVIVGLEADAALGGEEEVDEPRAVGMGDDKLEEGLAGFRVARIDDGGVLVDDETRRVQQVLLPAQSERQGVSVST